MGVSGGNKPVNFKAGEVFSFGLSYGMQFIFRDV